MTQKTSLENWNVAIELPNEEPASSVIVADICFDSKRRGGCYVCPLYKCAERDL